MSNGNKSPNETTRMVHRSPSRRRRDSRAVVETSHTDSPMLGRKQTTSPPYSRHVEFASSSPPQKKKELPNIPTYGRKYRRASIAVGAEEAGLNDHPRASRNSISAINHFIGHGITVTSPIEDDDRDDNMVEHKTVDELHSSLHMETSPRYKRHLTSEIPLHARTHRNSLTPDTKVNRSPSLTPDVLHNKSPRHSLVPDVLNDRSPRNSITPENSVYLKSPRGSFSVNPDIDLPSSSRNNLFADNETGRNMSGSSYNLAPDMHNYSRSPRNSLVPESSNMRSPRGSIIPESALSPRGSIAVDINRSPRGSLVPDTMLHNNRSPRGSIASETSHNRSPRNSLPLQEGSKRSPRGSITPTSMVQFDTKSPRGSVEYISGSMRPMTRTGSVGRNRRPREEVNMHELEANCQASPTPRRASSSVSADDRKRLCEQSKLNSESSGIGHAAYGSLTYQLEHATMESSNPFQFVYKALCIFYRTIFCSIILGSLVMLSSLMLIMGMNYKKDCPKEPRIVYYLIIGGLTGLIETALLLVRQIKSLRYDHSVQVHDLNPCSTDNVKTYSIVFLTCFCIFGFVLGNSYIYSIFWPEFSGTLFDPNRWCHHTLYIFCLIHMAVVYFYAICLVLFTVGLFFMQIFCPLWIRK
uniref:Uncharacterized protein n=1 Tax=Cacopsylla melanoneura TaxID=428564 RepID=A0A8D8Z764_9HEMI